MNSYRVGIAGFGAIGQAVAQSLDAGLPGLTLAAVAVRDPKAAPAVAWQNAKPVFTTIGELAEHCDVVSSAPPPPCSANWPSRCSRPARSWWC